MPEIRFLDTNIFVRHITQDNVELSPRASGYFARIERGDITVRSAATVVFETVFTLQSVYGQSRIAIRNAILPLLRLPGIRLPGKQRFERAFELYVTHNVSFADAYHAALVERMKPAEIVSFDRGLDRLPGIRRVEP